jgi:NAD+ synthase
MPRPFHIKQASGQRLNMQFNNVPVKHQVAIAYVNLVGGQDELVFDGGSFVVNANRAKW